MELEFDDPKLQKVCETERQMVRTLGPARAKKLSQRLSTLRSLDVVESLWNLPGHWHPLQADRLGQFAAYLDQPYRLVLRPTPPVPRNEHGGVDWSQVSAITVVEIINYH